jgi:hypothetical protein
LFYTYRIYESLSLSLFLSLSLQYLEMPGERQDWGRGTRVCLFVRHREGEEVYTGM